MDLSTGITDWIVPGNISMVLASINTTRGASCAASVCDTASSSSSLGAWSMSCVNGTGAGLVDELVDVLIGNSW